MRIIDNEKMGMAIARLRSHYHISAKQFAEDLGVSAAAVSQWEYGKGVKTENLCRIAAYFNVTIENILDNRFYFDTYLDDWEKVYRLEEKKNRSNLTKPFDPSTIDYIDSYARGLARFKELVAKMCDKSLDKESLEEARYLTSFYCPCFTGLMALSNPKIEQGAPASPEDVFKEGIQVLKGYDLSKSEARDFMIENVFELGFHDVISFLSMSDYKDRGAFLQCVSKIEKDNALAYLRSNVRLEYGIDKKELLLSLFEAGAEFRYFDADASNEGAILLPDINGFAGIVQLDEDKTKAASIFDPSMRHIQYSYEQYNKLIDHERTERIKKLSCTKAQNPKAYFEFIQEIDHLNK